MSEQPNEYQLRARALRVLAATHRARASELELATTVAETAGSMKRFIGLLTEAETREVAEHPDLAELNVQLDGLYGDDPMRPGEETTP